MNRFGHAFRKTIAAMLRDRLLVALIALALIAGAGLVVESKLKMAFEKDGLKVCLICSDAKITRSSD